MEWEPLAATSSRPSPRVGHTLSVLRGGRAILFGGRGRDSSDVLADPIQLLPALDAKQHPAVHGAAPPGRAGHVACTLTERSAVVFLGGEDAGGVAIMCPVLLEAPSYGPWHWCPLILDSSLPSARAGLSATPVGDDRFLVFGGRTSQGYSDDLLCLTLGQAAAAWDRECGECSDPCEAATLRASSPDAVSLSLTHTHTHPTPYALCPTPSTLHPAPQPLKPNP